MSASKTRETGRGAPSAAPELLSIGAAAARSGVSERALRYYQQMGLITPSAHTPGGLRRYSEADLQRVHHLRELQTLLGLNLDEVRSVLENEDHLAKLRAEYRAESTDAARRRELIAEALRVRHELRATVTAKLDALNLFLADLDESIARVSRLFEQGAPPLPANDHESPAGT